MDKFAAVQGEPPADWVGLLKIDALPDRRFSKMITVAWLTLGFASVALALMTALVLHSEGQSTAILRHLNLVALNIQEVLSNLADAQGEERVYLLTGRPNSLENFENSRRTLYLEFVRLSALVKDNPVERRQVERVRDLVEQQLDELKRSNASHTAAGSRVTKAEILTYRARELTEALRHSIYGINQEHEGTLAQLAQKRRVRLASALAAVCGALLLAGSYLLIGQITVSRNASQRLRN